MATVTAPRHPQIVVARVARRSLSVDTRAARHPAPGARHAGLRRHLCASPRPAQQAGSGEAHAGAVPGAVWMAHCPYVDNRSPLLVPQGNFDVPLGTDYLGRDILSRLMHGARISLVVALAGTLAAGVIGTWLGVLAGYLGGWWDQIIMRVTDAWLTLPSLVFAILLSSVRGPGLWNVVLILMLVFWSRYARIVRGEVLGLRERDFVKLAEINGVRKLRIIWRHIIPNVMNTVMVVFSLQIGVAVIIEASLSFLGVGVPPPEPSWGLMMAQERESLMEGRWWLAVFPGICITLLVLSANMLGDWLRVRLDPQLRNR